MNLKEALNSMEYGPAPESAEAAHAWLDEHKRKFGLFINNRWVTPAGAPGEPGRTELDPQRFYASYNPATGEKLADTYQAGPAEVDQAVAAARQAFQTWSKTPGFTRARYLYAIARNIQKHHRLLAVLEAMDNGKPVREARDIDVPLLARHFSYYAQHIGPPINLTSIVVRVEPDVLLSQNVPMARAMPDVVPVAAPRIAALHFLPVAVR